jgi:hypothetical protein
MCGKCGLNNCSCNSGKTCSKLFTGDLTFDGTSFICANGETNQIVTGETNLNAVLAKLFADMCAANNYIQKFAHKEHASDLNDVVLSGIIDEAEWLPFTAPMDGKYLFTYVISYQMVGSGAETNVSTSFFVGQGNPIVTYTEYGTGTTHSVPVSHVDANNNITSEHSVTIKAYQEMTQGDTRGLVSTALAFGSVGDITVTSVSGTFEKID